MAFADVTIYPGTSTLAAVICGRDTVLRGKALKIQSAVRDEAARHVASGDFLKSIKVATVPYRSKRGNVNDEYVYSDDPGYSRIDVA